MPSYKRPGVYIEEDLSRSNVPQQTSLGAAAFAAAHGRGPTEAATIESWNEFQRHYGGFDEGDDLAYALYTFFNNGGRRAHVRRVAAADSATAVRTLNDRAATANPTLEVAAANPGAWGNEVYLDVEDSGTDRFNLVFYYGGTAGANVVERWVDLSMDPADDRYVETLINHQSMGSAYVTVTDLASPEDVAVSRPAVQQGTALTGGADGTAPTAADVAGTLSSFDVVTDAFTLNLPNITDSSALGTAITYAENRGDVFVVIETPAGNDADQAVAFADGLASSSYAAVFYPRFYISDPKGGRNAVKLVPPGAAVAGKFAQTEALRGVHQAVAGLDADFSQAIGLERKLTDTDLETLHGSHVNAIRHMPGAGVAIMGARTLQKVGSDKYINVRRTLIFLKKSLVEGTQWALFEPNDPSLWDALESNVGQFLRNFWQDGGLKGRSASEAFYVKCDEDINTPLVVESGEVRVEVGVALQHPAEFIVIRIGQWEGGQSATEMV